MNINFEKRQEVADRNKLHLLCDEVRVVVVSDYSEVSYPTALMAAGVDVLNYKEFGSYQGDWWAQVKFPNNEVCYVTGSFGSCSGCDAAQSEFGYCDRKDADFGDRLKAFGRGYLENYYKLEQAIEEAGKHSSWDSEARDMVDTIKRWGGIEVPAAADVDEDIETFEVPKPGARILKSGMIIEMHDGSVHTFNGHGNFFMDGGTFFYFNAVSGEKLDLTEASTFEYLM